MNPIQIVGIAAIVVGGCLLLWLIGLQIRRISLARDAATEPRHERQAAAAQSATAGGDAAIAAAIAAVYLMLEQSGVSSNGLRVKSVRRVGVNIPAWGAAGRRENVSTRL
ncbi:MAG: hypothetical protein LBD02_05030 [Christensenellaceae bacterium]|nr:hypothetical protein [Christensenellaceae bacterium]